MKTVSQRKGEGWVYSACLYIHTITYIFTSFGEEEGGVVFGHFGAELSTDRWYIIKRLFPPCQARFTPGPFTRAISS